MAETAKSITRILLQQRDVPIYIWGLPGIGKSDVVKQAGGILSKPVTDVRLSLMDPTDLRGIPMIVNGEAQWMKPGFLPKEEGSILFFDELNHAAPSVQSAAFQIILDGRIGEHVLPKDTMRLAAGNKKANGMLGYDLPLPLKNRFIHIEMRHDLDDWLEWAEENDVDERVLAFIRAKSEMLMQVPASEKITTTYGFPTPRSWAFVSNILKGLTFARNVDILRPMIDGAIGPVASATFMAYLRMLEEYHTPDQVLANPGLVTKDTDKSILWSVLTTVAAIAEEKDADRFNTLMNNTHIPTELKAYTLRLVLNTHKKMWVIKGDAIKKFMNKDEVRLALESA
jgi:MoxR-like ATPase